MLVRQTEVARRWRGRCNEVTVAGLSRAGAAAIGPLAQQMAALRPSWVMHSDLICTRRLAQTIARAVLHDPCRPGTALPPAQHHRTVLQQTHILPPHRNPL